MLAQRIAIYYHYHMNGYFYLACVLGVSAGLLPGPLLTYAVSQTLQYGTKAGLKVVLTPLLTEVPMILFTLLVFSRIARYSPVVSIAGILGAVYLSYLAWGVFQSSKFAVTSGSVPGTLLKTITINLLNVNIYLFWLTTGGAAISQLHSMEERASFILIFIAALIVSMVVLVLAIAKVRRLIIENIYRYVMYALSLSLLFFAFLMIKNSLHLLTK